ncbi:hypothetical protein RHHCN13_07330 [Rickettsia conorii subsp. heilongjiangensis]|uniref:Uncharacterized protein n=1 Tax=Rickettsia conorii subsp. heilongjiangensis TaxID=226665 RepID=A0AAD1LSB2_RICCR|nr:hypothetical protein RHCH81_07330 [Rickettsia conorii subsp. heilongjiangensis]BBM92303.1 hypothetical protein RHHCN13_07330 [Rickettsia conorii subsp. heilongjiangensis]BBM93512.1 hypothetical protein RHSENDAI29_07330 [Rickettsia conorii subsp. heilongjiangensis]BBM94721.1 hypothetical protein RHSENDAI58_07330 [Rickettsia conorii subsp. heilongjiangensis]
MRGGIVAWTGKTHCITPWSSHGMTEVKLLHATIPPRNDVNLLIDLLLVNNTSQRTSRKVLQQ